MNCIAPVHVGTPAWLSWKQNHTRFRRPLSDVERIDLHITDAERASKGLDCTVRGDRSEAAPRNYEHSRISDLDEAERGSKKGERAKVGQITSCW